MKLDTIINQPVIETERFDLRPLRKSDMGLIEHYASDERVARMTTSIPHPLPPAATEAFVARAMADDRDEDVWAMDGTKDGGPELMGLISLQKMAQITRFVLLFAAIALHWTAVLIVLLCGYMVKSVMSYFQTKNRYQLNLTRNLYFQKLDTNAGVAFRMIQQAHRQATLEATLAYYATLTSEEPISKRRLRRRCERMLREAIDVEVDFQVDRALQQLIDLGAVKQDGERWTTCGLS